MMEDSLVNVGVDYPSQEVLLREWRSHASEWLKDAIDDINCVLPKMAAKTLKPERIEKLVNEKDSVQKVFDMYGSAMLLNTLKKPVRAKDLLMKLTEIVPYAAIYVDIAGISHDLRNSLERVFFLEKAFDVAPNNVVIWNLLGSALMNVLDKKNGIELLRKSAELRPENKMIYSNYLFNMHHSEELDCDEIFAAHKRWASYNSVKDVVITDHANDPDPGRKLRIGYISPDFRSHPVGLFFKPILDYRNMKEIEVFGYGNVGVRDAYTDILETMFDRYHSIIGIDDKKVVDMIVNDKIDILVDLAGHTGGNRLGVMAHKPAPVQVTYLGYFDTTGLDEIDYFLTDKQMSPPQSQKYHTENLFYLPDTSLCYKILNKTPDVATSPFLENGYITFGMYTNPNKITQKMASLWASILNNTKDSRLRLMIKNGHEEETSKFFLQSLVDAGVPAERIDICGRKPIYDYLAEYSKVDMILDTYPYNGGATTCDALWMGVPVVSLVGEHHFSRVGLSLLTSVGLDFFAATSPEEYVAKASVLADKPESLSKIRGTLRQRMQASVMCDLHLQTRNIESSYRQMWHKWCQEKNNCNL